MPVIRDFYELTCPEQDGASEGRDWTAHNIPSINFCLYLLNDGSNNLIDLLDLKDTTDIYFDTEQDCHAAGFEYYLSHNKPYPHVRAYQDCLNRLADEASDIVLKNMGNNSQTIQSEEMKF